MLNVMKILLTLWVFPNFCRGESFPLEVGWVFQGRKFGFTGFFLEMLGFIDKFNMYFPEGSVFQSSFEHTGGRLDRWRWLLPRPMSVLETAGTAKLELQ